MEELKKSSKESMEELKRSNKEILDAVTPLKQSPPFLWLGRAGGYVPVAPPFCHNEMQDERVRQIKETQTEIKREIAEAQKEQKNSFSELRAEPLVS